MILLTSSGKIGAGAIDLVSSTEKIKFIGYAHLEWYYTRGTSTYSQGNQGSQGTQGSQRVVRTVRVVRAVMAVRVVRVVRVVRGVSYVMRVESKIALIHVLTATEETSQAQAVLKHFCIFLERKKNSSPLDLSALPQVKISPDVQPCKATAVQKN